MPEQMALVAPSLVEIQEVFGPGEWLTLVEMRRRLGLPLSRFAAVSAAMATLVLHGPFDRRRDPGVPEWSFRPMPRQNQVDPGVGA